MALVHFLLTLFSNMYLKYFFLQVLNIKGRFTEQNRMIGL